MARRPQTIEVTAAARGTSGLNGSGTDLATQYDANGAAGNGETDDSTIITTVTTAVAADVKRARFGAKTYVFSTLEPGSNVQILTAGLSTTFKQKLGVASGTPIIVVRGASGITVESYSAIGNIADDTGEWNHAGGVLHLAAAPAQSNNIRFGDINATDIRGDGWCTGIHPDAYTAGYTMSGLSVGRVTTYNCLRNTISVTTGRDLTQQAAVSRGGCGYMTHDIEPDPGSGPISSNRCYYIFGRNAGIACTTAAVYAEGIYYGMVDLSPANTAGNSTPPYAGWSAVKDNGFLVRNTRSAHIDFLKAEGFDAQALKQVWNSGELAYQQVSITHLRGRNNALTDTLYRADVFAGNHLDLNIKFSDTDAPTALQRAYNQASNLFIGLARHTGIAGTSFLYDGADELVGTIQQVGGSAATSVTRARFLGGIFNGERFFSFCTRSFGWGMEITASVGWDVGGTNNSLWCSRVGAVFYYVLTAQWNVDANGNIFTEGNFRQRGTSPMGYHPGNNVGASVTQLTSKSTTAPAINKPTGKIIMNNAALAAGARVSFDVPCDKITTTTNIILNIVGGVGDAGNYTRQADVKVAGTMRITLGNVSAGSLGEPVELQYSLINGSIN